MRVRGYSNEQSKTGRLTRPFFICPFYMLIPMRFRHHP